MTYTDYTETSEPVELDYDELNERFEALAAWALDASADLLDLDAQISELVSIVAEQHRELEALRAAAAA